MSASVGNGVMDKAGETRRRMPRLARPECKPSSVIPGKKTLVWIDDYEPGLALYKSMFESLGFRVFTASQGKLGLGLIDSEHVDAVVVDYEMPGMNGEAVTSAIKKNRPDLPVVMFSGSSGIPDRVLNLVDAYCDKAGSREQLVSAIQGVLQSAPNHRSAASVYAA
jgi:CheY-like chemotaxis protein